MRDKTEVDASYIMLRRQLANPSAAVGQSFRVVYPFLPRRLVIPSAAFGQSFRGVYLPFGFAGRIILV
jgi:hypothetical protein